jgi:hypothetical protein
MTRIKSILESKLGAIGNDELAYAINKLENTNLTTIEDTPCVILDKLSTYIDDYRKRGWVK